MKEEFKTFLEELGISVNAYESGTLAEKTRLIELFNNRMFLITLILCFFTTILTCRFVLIAFY